MNESADIASTIPAIILFSFWWAFLSTLELLSRQSGSKNGDGLNPNGFGGKIHAVAEADSPEFREVDPEFDPRAFLAGACSAYEAILRAYARCEPEMLRRVLSAEVYQAFMEACDERAASGETLELTFIGIDKAEITHIERIPDAVEITVLFRAQIVCAERSAAGVVIGGDPIAVTTTADLWTFSRAGAAEWLVVATDAA